MTQGANVKVSTGIYWDVQSDGNSHDEPCVLVPVSAIENFTPEELVECLRNAVYAAKLCKAIFNASYILDRIKGYKPVQIARLYSLQTLDELRPYQEEHFTIDAAISALETAFAAMGKIKEARSEVATNYEALFNAIGDRDGYWCANCKDIKVDLQIDHIIPVSKGGNSKLNNLQLLCRKCNVAKGAKV